MLKQTTRLIRNLDEFLANDPCQIDLFFISFVEGIKLPTEAFRKGLHFLDGLLAQSNAPQILVAKALWLKFNPEASDLSDSIMLLEQAIKQGNLLAYSGKAICLLLSNNFSNYLEAIELLRIAAQKNCFIAMTYLAECHLKGFDCVKNMVKTEAMMLLKTASDAGFNIARAKLAYYYFFDDPPNCTEAISLSCMASDAGFGYATDLLGIYYLFDLDYFPKNIAEATKLAEIAAEDGYCSTLFELAKKYEHGEDDVPQNFFEAFKLYLIASDKGHLGATHNLACIYMGGRDIEPRAREAIKLFQTAAKAGYSASHHALASIYYYGMSVRKDLNLAIYHCFQALIYAKNISAIVVELDILNKTLKQLHFNVTYIALIAWHCAKICKNPFLEGAHFKAKELLSCLREALPDNYEVHYIAAMIFGDTFLNGWLFNSIGATHRHITSAVKQVIAKDPNQFVACLIKDNFNTAIYKKALYVYIAEYHLPELSGNSIIACLDSLNELDALRRDPKSYFSLLPHDIMQFISQPATPATNQPFKFQLK